MSESELCAKDRDCTDPNCAEKHTPPPHYPYQDTPHGFVTQIHGERQWRWTCDRCGNGAGGYFTQDQASQAFGEHLAELWALELATETERISG